MWDQLAAELEGEVYVAKVNGPKYKALTKRLHVSAYPTILYLRDGEMREYSAARTLAQLAAFGRKSWRNTKPVPFFKAPNNWFGRMVGVLFRVPGMVEEAYGILRKEWHLSDVSILFLALMIPTASGMMCIALADAWVVRSVRQQSAAARNRAALLAAQRQQQAAGAGGLAGAQPVHPHPHHE